MAYRWHPKNAEVDPDSPRAWGTCDRCGMIWQLDQLQWQMAYQGSQTPQNTRFLVCPKHLDPLNEQDSPNLLSPDPLPVFNSRPEPYTLDEASWLSTQDGDRITTQDGELFTVAIPNPQSDASTAHLQSSITASGASVATLYLDIFNGNPSAGGVSVLSAITGSSVRTDIASLLTTVLGVAENTDQIVVALESASTVNTNHIAFYSASISGSLLMSAALSVNGQSVTVGNPVVFDALAIQINTN